MGIRHLRKRVLPIRANWQYSDHQIHVTADVVYGIAHYAYATRDLDYLKGPAACVITEAARYFLERVDRRPGDDYLSILGVMGPDEYTPISHNNSYTNRMVSFVFDLASKVGKHGGASESECRTFNEIAMALPILETKQACASCEDLRLAEPDFANWAGQRKPFASKYRRRDYTAQSASSSRCDSANGAVSHEFEKLRSAEAGIIICRHYA